MKALASMYESLSSQSEECVKRSIEYYEKIIELNIYDGEVFYALGRLYYRLGNF
jgi:tetratricopeptide (TPR) repeat protein